MIILNLERDVYKYIIQYGYIYIYTWYICMCACYCVEYFTALDNIWDNLETYSIHGSWYIFCPWNKVWGKRRPGSGALLNTFAIPNARFINSTRFIIHGGRNGQVNQLESLSLVYWTCWGFCNFVDLLLSYRQVNSLAIHSNSLFKWVLPWNIDLGSKLNPFPQTPPGCQLLLRGPLRGLQQRGSDHVIGGRISSRSLLVPQNMILEHFQHISLESSFTFRCFKRTTKSVPCEDPQFSDYSCLLSFPTATMTTWPQLQQALVSLFGKVGQASTGPSNWRYKYPSNWRWVSFTWGSNMGFFGRVFVKSKAIVSLVWVSSQHFQVNFAGASCMLCHVVYRDAIHL